MKSENKQDLLLEEITYLKEYNEKNFKANLEKLQQDFCYQLSWIGQETWRYGYMANFWKEVLKRVKEDEKRTRAFLDLKDFIELRINRFDFSSSTNQISNQQSIWEFNCLRDAKDKLESLQNRLNKTNEQ